MIAMLAKDMLPSENNVHYGKFVSECPIGDTSSLILVTAWRRPGM